MNEAGPQVAGAVSFGQQGMLFQQQVSGASPIFNIPTVLTLHGPIDPAALAAAVDLLVLRHDVLRTTYSYPDRDGAVRMVHPAPVGVLQRHDLRDQPAGERPGSAQALVAGAVGAAFDLERDLPIRAFLVTIDDDEHVLGWVIHHIACDGWSKSIIAAELSAAYVAYRSGEQPVLPALSADFGDYVEREQSAVHDTGLARDLAYWTAHLAGTDRLAGLRHDHETSIVADIVGDDVPFTISAQVRSALVTSAGRHRATPFMAMLAALSCVVTHDSKDAEALVNVPHANRPASALEGVIGFLVNVAMLRIPCAPDDRLADVLARARDCAIDAYEHLRVPYQRVVEQLAAGSDAGAFGPLFQVSLSFQNLPYCAVELPGVHIETYPLRRSDVRYELEVHIWEDDTTGGYGGRFIYNRALFDRDTVRKWVAEFVRLLDQLGHNPELTLGALGLAERSIGESGDDWAWDVTPREDDSAVTWTQTQSAVAAIWADLLHIDDFGLDDNFFDVGGHSFLTALMISRLRDTCGVHLPIRTVFGDPTIRGIATALEAQLSTPAAGRTN